MLEPALSRKLVAGRTLSVLNRAARQATIQFVEIVKLTVILAKVSTGAVP